MPNYFLSPSFSTLRRTLMASTQITSDTVITLRLNPSSSKYSVNNSNTILSHYHNLNPPTKLPHYFRPRFDVGVGLSSSSMRSNSFCTASENKDDTSTKTDQDPDLWNVLKDFNVLKGWNVPWSWPTTILTVAIADTTSRTPFIVATKVFEYFLVSATLGPNVNGIIQVVTSCIAASILFGVIYFVRRLYQPIPKDIFYWDFKEPFNPRKGWLLWTIISLDCLYALTFFRRYKGTDLTETVEEPRDKWWYVLVQYTNFSTLCVFVCMSIIGPVAEEVLHRGFFLASLTKWVPTPVAVLINAVVFAMIHRDPNPDAFRGHCITGSIMGLAYLQTRNLLTPIAIHSLFNTILITCSMSK